MKRLLTLIALVYIYFSADAQTASATLDENNSAIQLLNGGDFFWDFKASQYSVPKSSSSSNSKSTIWSGGIWISGLDDNDDLHVAAMTYRQAGKDFFPGPSSYKATTTRSNFDHIYVVSQTDISNFKSNPSNITDDIKNWPGNGDTSIGEPFMLAPFVDQNHNGIYETSKGDYPLIKGEVAAYCIYNDNGTHTETNGKAFNFDVHQLFYQDKLNAKGGLFNETNLAYFKIVNRSTETYHDVKFGVFVDFELGDGTDDFIGSDSNLNMAFVYNSDNNDDGSYGYGTNPPSQNVMFLNKKAYAVAYYSNDFSADQGNPSTPKNYDNLLSGRLTSGKTFDQIHGSIAKNTRFAFHGDPSDTTEWSEVSAKRFSGDRRAVLTASPTTLAPGETACYDIAFVYGRSDSGHIASYQKMRAIAKDVQTAYNQDYNSWASFACGSATSGIKQVSINSLRVYPNPTTGIVKLDGLFKTEFAIFNSLGQKLDIAINETSEIDLSNYPSGVYFIQTEVGNARIVKQ